MHYNLKGCVLINTLRPRQDGRLFPDDIFICIFLNENEWNSIKISLKFVPTVPINNIPALVQIMAWRRLGDKPLSEPMMVVFRRIYASQIHTGTARVSQGQIAGPTMPQLVPGRFPLIQGCPQATLQIIWRYCGSKICSDGIIPYGSVMGCDWGISQASTMTLSSGISSCENMP